MSDPPLHSLPVPFSTRKEWPWTEGPRGPSSPKFENKTWPRISIVTPSYNQGAFIEETIRSVLLQGYPNLEYIIIDGGSTDNSVEIIKKYEPWLSYWVSERDAGQANALNKGFEQATGDIYAYINSDDVYEKGIFETVGRLFLKAPDQFWSAFKVVDFNSEGFRRPLKLNEFQGLYHWIYEDGMIPQPSVFWARRLHEEANGFDESMHFVFDKDFFLRLLIRGYIYTCHPETVASFFRLHSDSKTCSSPEQFEIEKLAMRRKVQTLLSPAQKRVLDLAQRHSAVIDRIRASWEDDALQFRDSIATLLATIGIQPSIVLNRFFWGGVKRVLKKASPIILQK